MKINCLISEPIGEDIINRLIKAHREDTSVGGISFFIGQVRADSVNGLRVKAIEYTAYELMVKAEIKKIISEIFSEFDDVKTVEIIHSSGIVKAGEISLLILVSAGHRQQAISACTKTIELVKAKLPIWKKEIFDDDSHFWK